MKKKDILKEWFETAINVNQKLPLPKTSLYADLLSIIYQSNGVPEDIILTILSRGLVKTTHMTKKYLSFMTRVGMTYKTKQTKKIEIKKDYLPPK